jgi:hypothetical protein
MRGYFFGLPRDRAARATQALITAPRSRGNEAWLKRLLVWDGSFQAQFVSETKCEATLKHWVTPSDGVYQIGYANRDLAERSFLEITDGCIAFINQARAIQRTAHPSALYEHLARLKKQQPGTPRERRERDAQIALVKTALGEDAPMTFAELARQSTSSAMRRAA